MDMRESYVIKTNLLENLRSKFLQLYPIFRKGFGYLVKAMWGWAFK